ncbi:hypothetical protein HDU76_009685, partial [Blyttiomyces sp. JEL0837]
FPSSNGIPSPAGTQLQIYHAHSTDAQYFRFIPYPDGKTYSLVNKKTSYCLELTNNANANISPIGLNICNGKDIQRWYVNPLSILSGGVTAQIVAYTSEKCLNVQYAKYEDHNPVVLYDCIDGDLASIWNVNYNTLPDKQLVPVQHTNSPPVLHNVEVTVLLWGSVPNADKYPDFYTSILNSKVFDVLGQYNVSRGTYKSTLQLPPPGAKPLPTTSNSIASYIKYLIVGGFLTPNKNSYYAIHFGTDINTNVTNCSTYCGYHDAAAINSTLYVPYGVLPDLTPCSTTCYGNTAFESQTITAAHELFEAITDPIPGTGYLHVLTDAEVGDLCSSRGSFSISGSSGISYTVPKFWSNAAGACV